MSKLLKIAFIMGILGILLTGIVSADYSVTYYVPTTYTQEWVESGHWETDPDDSGGYTYWVDTSHYATVIDVPGHDATFTVIGGDDSVDSETLDEDGDLIATPSENDTLVSDIEEEDDKIIEDGDAASGELAANDESIDARNEAAAEEEFNQTKELEESYSAAPGDPVRITSGTFITSETDIKMPYIDFDTSIERTYLSSNKSNHSLGSGWIFNFDVRIIRGVKYQANEEVQDITDTKSSIEGLLSSATEKYNTALLEINGVIVEVDEIVDRVVSTITALENALAGSLPSQVREQLVEDLAYANTKLPAALAFQNRANDAKQDILDSYDYIEDMQAAVDVLKIELAKAEDKASLANANSAINRYVVNDSDPSFYQLTGNESLTLVDESGSPHRYRLLQEPEYSSTNIYSDGSTNFYPNGSITESVQPIDDTLELLPDGNLVLTKKDKTKHYYSLYGQLVKIEDPNGNNLVFSYDSHRLVKITDDFGRETSITRSGDKITSILAPDGSSVSYGYDSTGHLFSVTDTEGDTVQYAYYSSGEIEKIIKPDNSFRQYNYITQNGKRVVSSTVDEEGDTEYFSYHFDEGYTEYTNPAGVKEFHYYDERNRETKVIYADGSYIENTYDDDNNLISTRSRTGYVTDFEYDENRNIIRTSYPDGTYETRSYNSFSKPVEITDPDGNRIVNDYDSKGNLTLTSIYGEGGALESEQAYDYTAEGLVKSKTSWNTGRSLNTTEYYFYDDYGNISSVADGEGNSWDYIFGVTGQLESVTDPLGNTTGYEYTSAGKITKVTYPGGTTEQTFYTERKDIDYVIDRDGNRYDYIYNKRHNLLSVENPLGETVEYTYNPMGEVLTKSIYAGNNLEAYWEYQYDPYTGKLISQKQQLDDSSFTETGYEYDNGLLWKITDPVGTVTEFTYNSRDRASARTIYGETLEFPVTEFMDYTGRGLLKKYTDPLGNETEYEYTALGKAASVLNPDYSRKEYEYDGAGRILSAADEEGYKTEYKYNNNGRRSEVIYSDSTKEKWEYNQSGHVTSYTDRNGTVFNYDVDAFGRVLVKELPEPYTGATESFTYNNRNQILTWTDANNNTWTRNYDEMGRLIETIDPEGNVTTNEYTPLGQITKTTTPDNALWEQSYDMAGRVTSSTDPLGAVSSYIYNEAGRILSSDDPMGKIDTYTWDSLGRLSSTRDGENSGVDYTYDPAGNRTSETQTGGLPYEYFYDSRNRLTKEVNRLNDEKIYDYYRNGQIKTITDFNNDQTSFTYNDAARLAEKEFENGDRESYTYDGMGNLLTAVNPAAELEYTYDPLGRLTESIDHFKDQVISYGYDAGGNRTSLTWAEENRTTTWDYNTLNLPVKMTDPEGEVTQFNYDPMGRETARILPNGITRETMFNEAGRITSINHTDGKSNETMPAQFYAYNDAGQKILQLDETGRVTAWEYDNAGRLAEASYAFAGGKSVTDFWERIYLGVIPEDIANGKLGETDTLTAEIETLVNQNPILGELGFTNKNYMDNLDEAYLELSDVFPDLKELDFKSAAKPKNDFTFKANWGHLHKFLPDEIDKYFNPGHIADLLEQPQWTESFSYDLKGNLTNKTNGWGDISYTYNAENQLVKAGEREYSFDNNGNMTAEWTGDLTASYVYDKENRLTEVTTNHQGFIGSPGNLMDMGILYSYDSLGRRVSREEITDMQNGDYRDRFRSSGERMSYLYDGLSFNMLAEGRDASGIDTNGGWHSTTSRDFKPTSEYLRTNGRVITRTDVTTEGHSLLDSYTGGYLEKGYYMEDSLGSVMAITNSKGSITESYSYDSFGRLTEGSFDGINRLGYNGKRVDPVTGRLDYGFRDYSPMLGRFTTVDPIKDGSNWYVYVSNDPINRIDPDGLDDVYLNYNRDNDTISMLFVGRTASGGIDESRIVKQDYSVTNNVLTPEQRGNIPVTYDPDGNPATDNSYSYFPTEFPDSPKEGWDLGKSYTSTNPLVGTAIPTNANQDVTTLEEINGNWEESGTVNDAGYLIHAGTGCTTWGCLKDGEAEIKDLATYSDAAVISGGEAKLFTTGGKND